jgi:NADH dehydrogenase (ubiquinone) 1 alpha/beta subcomplex 1
MFRLALKQARALRVTPLTRNSFSPFTGAFQTPYNSRWYSHAPPLTPELVDQRIIEILEGYDKVNKDVTISNETDFSRDLGLDSLDIVEVVMAIEEEFSIGIPDEQADKIRTFKDARELILNNPHAV